MTTVTETSAELQDQGTPMVKEPGKHQRSKPANSLRFMLESSSLTLHIFSKDCELHNRTAYIGYLYERT